MASRSPLIVELGFIVIGSLLIHGLIFEKVHCPSSCSCLGHLVDCSRRGLIEIPPDLPVWLEILELQNNDITHVSQTAFQGLVNLQQLDLSHNQLRFLENTSLVHLPNLRELKIQHNHLIEIPDLGYLPNLTTLILHHNEIHALTRDALLSLPFLRTLDLNHNRLIELNSGVFPENNHILHLHLSNNRIVDLEPECLDNLTNLETLRLNRNRLKSVPKHIFQKLRGLKILEMNRNNLTKFEGLTFNGLESLQILRVRHNSIHALLDGAFWGLNNIQQLKLDNNNITIISKGWLYGLASLQQLSLRHNRISEIEDNCWEFSPDLWELDISYNKLTEIRKPTFQKLGKLQELILNHNQISYLEDGIFKALQKLEKLDLDYNEISWAIEDTNGAFIGLEHLSYLQLQSNSITSIAKKAFQGLDSLKHLDLGNNAITSIQNNAFQGMHRLQNLIFNSSHLLCDCNLRWLPEWLLESGYQTSVIAQCAHPDRLMGKSIFEISPDEFTCADFPKPYIVEEPKTQVSLKGADVMLVCSAESSSKSPMTFQWKKDNLNIKNIHVETVAAVSITNEDITQYKSTLTLWNISDKDEGRYQCVVSNNYGTTYSTKAKITVHVFPVFLKTPSDVTVKAGSTARLECAARGQPIPVIAWQKDGGDDFPAARERRMHVIPTDDVFFIVNVKTSDIGMYSCTAQNAAGLIMANATLTVLETPTFMKAFEDKVSRVGETTVLECMAKGSPKPKLTWLKDGSVIYPSDRHFFTADSQLLIIVHTQHSDGGLYTCEMSNMLGTERGTAFLKIMPISTAGTDDESMTTGIIVIAVVCCIVGTSLVWVIIIYQTRKRSEELAASINATKPCASSDLAPYPSYASTKSEILNGSITRLHVDSNSEISKDSGTGDSTDLCMLGAKKKDRRRKAGHTNSIDPFGAISQEQPSDCSLETLTSTSSTQTTRSGDVLPSARPTNHERSSPSSTLPFRQRLNESDVAPWPITARSQSVDLLSELNSPEDGSTEVNRNVSCATFPRKISSSLPGWSTGSLRHVQLPKGVQNDSGSFSIDSDETQPLHLTLCQDNNSPRYAMTNGQDPETGIPQKSPLQRHTLVLPYW